MIMYFTHICQAVESSLETLRALHVHSTERFCLYKALKWSPVRFIRLVAEVALLARLHTDLPEHHAREQPHVPREHVQPDRIVGARAGGEVRQVFRDAVAENL